jgi:hypothetical protein
MRSIVAASFFFTAAWYSGVECCKHFSIVVRRRNQPANKSHHRKHNNRNGNSNRSIHLFSRYVVVLLLSRMPHGNASLPCRHDFLRRAIAAMMGQL